MLGARSTVATAVGSRPKLNTVRTSAVNTAAETSAVRERNSSTKSLRAITHARRRASPTGAPPAVGGPNLRRAARAARREVHEAAPRLERHVGGELDPLIHV